MMTKTGSMFCWVSCLIALPCRVCHEKREAENCYETKIKNKQMNKNSFIYNKIGHHSASLSTMIDLLAWQDALSWKRQQRAGTCHQASETNILLLKTAQGVTWHVFCLPHQHTHACLLHASSVD